MKAVRRKPQVAWPQLQLEPHEISALKLMMAQHPKAVAVLTEKICLGGRQSFELGLGGEDGRRMTDFNEGRRWCGTTLSMIRDLKMPAPKQTGEGPHAVPKGAPPT